MREVYRWWFGCVVLIVLAGTCTTYSHPCMKEIVQVPAILATRVMLSGGVLPWRWRRTSSFGRPAGLQHAHLVLRPIERSLRAAPGWGVACASSKFPGRKSVVGPCSGRLGQRPRRPWEVDRQGLPVALCENENVYGHLTSRPITARPYGGSTAFMILRILR